MGKTKVNKLCFNFSSIIYISTSFMLKTLLKIFIIILVLSAGVLFILFSPKYASELSYNGEVTSIRRDASNIPTITAGSRKGYLYALGRVHAEDRLFQMSFKLLVVQGRLSEYLGERPLPMDKFMREVNLYGWGLRMAERLERDNRSQYDDLQSYVDGINDFASTLLVLPFDFHLIGFKWQNWTVGDVMGLFKQLQWSQSSSLTDEYARSHLLGENYTKQQVQEFLPNTKKAWAFGSTITVEDSLIPEELTTEFLKKTKSAEPAFHPSIIKQYQELGLFDQFKTSEGSNEFAISGNHTASGQPILAHDPHLQNAMPSQWYQVQVIYTHNGLQNSLSGISCSGLPFIIGKTDYSTFAITTIYTDNQDLYREKIEAEKYQVNGKWLDLKVREERIKVKTSKGIIEEVYPIRETHRGPLIHYILCGFGSYAFQDNISLVWTGFSDEYDPVVSISHLAEFKTLPALKKFILEDTKFHFNVNAAFITRDGHIGYQQLGRYPIRANPESGLYIKDGTTTDHDWLGFVPHTHRLQIIDPPSGYIVSANNKIASSEYYNGLHDYAMYTARSDRLHQVISEGIAKGRKFTVEDAKQIVTDTVDVYCLQMQSYLKAGIPEAGSALTGFDCNFVAGSWQATMYEVFLYHLHHLIKPHTTDKMSVLSMHCNAQYLFNYIKSAIKDQQKAATLKSAWGKMKETLNQFFKTSNSSQWRWGQYHKDVMHHLPFSSSPLGFLYDRTYEGSGNLHTVNVGKMNKVQFGDFQTSHRANYRAVYSYAEESYWIIDSGSSEKFFSKHYDDQWQLFRRNQFLPLLDPRPSRPSAAAEL